MKKFLAGMLAIISLFGLSACTIHGGEFGFGKNIAGEGEVITKEYKNLSASALRIKDIHVKQDGVVSQVNVKVTGGREKKVTLTAQENLFDYLTVGENDGKIEIKGNNLENYVTSEIVIEVSGYTFSELHLSCCKGEIVNETVAENGMIFLSGASDMELNDLQMLKLTADVSGASKLISNKMNVVDLMLHVSGASKVECKSLTAVDVDLNGSGASHISLVGETSGYTANISGATTIQARDLLTKKAKVDASGASKAKVCASEKLTLSASGASEIEYFGNASVTENASGGSTIKKG